MELFDLEIPIRATGGQTVKAQFEELEAQAKITDARISKPSVVKVDGVPQATAQLTALGTAATETAASVSKPAAVTIDGIPQAVAQLASIGTAATESGRFTVDAINRQITAAMAGASATDVQRETVIALQEAEQSYAAALRAGNLTTQQAVTVSRELASVRQALAAVPSGVLAQSSSPVPAGLATEVSSVSASILTLQTRAAQLRAEFRANDISALQYSRSMAALNAEVKTLAATEGITAAETRALNGLLVRTTTSAKGLASQGLDVVRASALTMVPSLLGVNGAVGTMASSFLAFSTGGPVTLAVVTGIGIIVAAYKMATEATDAARKSSDEYIESLRKQAEQEGHTALAAINAVKARRDELKARIAQGPSELDAAQAVLAIGPGTSFNDALANIQAKRTKELAELDRLLGIAEKNAATDTEQSRRRGIAALVSYGQALADNIRLKGADAATTRNAEANERLLLTVGHDAKRNIEERNAALAAAGAIHDALHPKEKRTREDVESASDLIRDQVGLLTELTSVRALTGDEVARLGDIIATVDDLQEHANLTDKEQITLLKARTEAVRLLSAATAASLPTHPTFGRDTAVAAPRAQLPTGFNQREAPAFGGGMGDPFTLGGPGSALKSIDALGPQVRQHGVTLGKELSTGFASGFADDMKDTAQGMAQGLSEAITGAFESAFSGGGIAGLFTGFGKAILASLGGIFTQMGSAMIAASPIFTALSAALWNPFTAGPALLAEGAALVAVGAALGAIAHSGGGSHAGGGPAAGAPTQQIIYYQPGLTANAGSMKSAMAASTITPLKGDTFNTTVIGPNDPVAQRQIGELWRNAQKRGLT